MANRIQLRRGSAQEWSNVNPTLAIGELGIEIDTGRIKIGDGVTPWNSLKYERPIESVANSPNTLVQRDADGNFAAGAITASVIGNASTATRLANTRQIALTGDVTASATFDGSSNLNLSSALQIVSTLPHYDNTPTSSGTYTKVTVDAKGRITNASNPTTLAGYSLNGTVEGASAQPYDRDLQGISDLTTVGIITRVSDGNITTRTVTGTSGRISVTNGSGVGGNPTLDLINTTVSSGDYNTESLTSSTFGSQTVNTTKFSVDQWGRLTSATTVPIATAVEGTTASAWVTGTVYARYDKVTNAGRLYQALNAGTSGVTTPVHTSGDATDGTVRWRHLGLVTTRQKGLASFDQEDFDVDANGHVMIALSGVDNTHLQNNQIRFADGNTFTSYELDNELTATTGYRGITTINDLSVNNTSGSPLLKCLAADDNVDINTTTSTIFSDITLDKTSNAIQTITRAGGLTIENNSNNGNNRYLRLLSTNAGAGTAGVELRADDTVEITSTNSTLTLSAAQQISLISSSADVRIEDFYFASNTISSTNSNIILDPAGIGDNTGSVQIKGNLQVDGTTITVNSTTMTVDDPIITLGGDTAPTIDDNKDRGVEFRYFDTQARLGFYGWDDSYTTLAGTTGGYRFLYNATNTSEVFSGTDAGVIAGNLALSSNTGSTSTTSGTLVVTGGTGISQNLWVGGTANVAGAVTFQSTLGVTDDVTLNKNVTIIGSDTAATEFFKIKNASSVDKFTVDSSSGNTTIVGTLGVTGASTLTGNLTTQSASVVNIQNTTINNVAGAIAGTAYASLGTYGVLKVDGGASFAKGLIVGGDLKIYGQFDVDGAVSYSGNTVFKGNISVDNDGLAPYKFNVASTTGAIDTVGIITTTNATDSSATNNGALVVTGGVGIGAQLRVGGATTITGNTTLNNNVTIVGSNTAATELFKIQNASLADKFTVDSATGNTTIVGTLGVQDVVTFSKNTDASALGTGALVVSAGGASINNQLRVGGDSTFTGDLAVNGGDITTTSTTATLFNANATTLNIGQAATTVSIGATTGTLTIRNASTVITGNLTVNGVTTTVNSTTITVDDPIITLGGDTAPSSDDNKDRGVEFRYFDVSAKLGFFGWDDSSSGYRFLENATNTSEVFSGTDAELFAGKLTLSKAGVGLAVTNNATIGGTLGVTSNATITGTLGVTSTSTFTGATTHTGGGTLKNIQIGITGTNVIDTVSGNLTIDSVGGTTNITDILTVSGATTLQSSLDVTGISTFTGLLNANGGADIKNVQIGVTGTNVIDTVSGNLTINSVGGTVTIDDIVSISGVTSVTSNTAQTVTGVSYTSDGAFRVTGGAGIAGNVSIGGDLRVFGSSVISGGVTYSGTQSYNGVIAQSNVTDAASSTDTAASISTAGGVAIAKKLFVGTNTSVGGTLGVTGVTTLSSTLGVTGLITANAGITIIGGTGEDFTIQDASSVTKFSVSSVTGNTVIEGSLNAKGNTTLGDVVGDVITVNGTATFNNADITGTIRDARKWTNARTLSISSDATGSVSVDGSTNADIVLTLANTGVGAGTYKSVTVDTKGRVTAATNPTTLSGFGIVDGQPLDSDLTAISGLTTTGFISRTGTGTAVTRSIAVSGTGISITNADGISGNPTIASNATASNSANAIVSRDASGNFIAGTITAALNGNAATATKLASAVTINGTSFDGSANISYTTSAVAEGTNLYYTDERVDDRLNALLIAGTGIQKTYDDLNNTYTLALDFTEFSTTNVVEGTNLYFTDERAQDAINLAIVTNATHSGVTVAYDDVNNAINITRNTLTYATSNQNGTGSKTAFSVNSGRNVNNMLVVANGLILAPTAEYTYTDSTTKLSTGGLSTNTFITVASTTGLVPGMDVSGTGIGTGAVITTIVGTTVNLSVANTASTIGNTITFGAVVTLVTAPTAGTNNVSIRYLPL